jgi:hypothetical protein
MARDRARESPSPADWVADWLRSFSHNPCTNFLEDETSAVVWTLATQMKSHRTHLSGEGVDKLERQLIRVDHPLTNADITAALRRAFSVAATAPCDHDFEELLRRLN